MKKIITLLSLLVFAIFAVGCGSSSGGGGTSASGGGGTAGVRGNVADEYVSNATVKIYDEVSFDSDALVDTVTTDARGHFVISETDVRDKNYPDTLFIKTEGGTEPETGFPAPTMKFVGDSRANPRSDTINITPLTDALFEQYRKSGEKLADAKNKLASSDTMLGDFEDKDNLYADVVADSHIDEVDTATERSIASGQLSGSIGPGDYVMYVSPYDRSYATEGDKTLNFSQDFNNLGAIDTLPVTVSDTGLLTDRVPYEDFEMTGQIQGSSLVAEVFEQGDTIRLAGNIGTLGNISGVAITKQSDTEQGRGVFVAGLVPESGIDSEGLANKIETFYSDTMIFLARTTFRNITDPVGLHWGHMNFASKNVYDTSTHKLATGGPFMAKDWWQPDAPPHELSYGEQPQVLYDNGRPTGLMAFQVADDGLAIMPLGSRRGIYIEQEGSGDTVNVIGSIYMVKHNSLPPITGGDTYYIHMHHVRNGFVDITAFLDNPADPNDHPSGKPLDDAVQEIKNAAVAEPVWIPAFSQMTGQNCKGDSTDLIAYAGSSISMLHDEGETPPTQDENLQEINAGGGMATDESINLQFYQSGAFSGEISLGGAPEIPGVDTWVASNRPVPIVGYARKKGDSAPDYSGTTFDFIYRSIADTANYSGKDPVGKATLTIPETTLDSALITKVNGDTFSMSWEKMDSNTFYHIYGAVGGAGSDDEIHIFWPVGGKKALFLQGSDFDEDLTKEVEAIGEAYLTY